MKQIYQAPVREELMSILQKEVMNGIRSLRTYLYSLFQGKKKIIYIIFKKYIKTKI